jgi:hypothetical protein
MEAKQEHGPTRRRSTAWRRSSLDPAAAVLDQAVAGSIWRRWARSKVAAGSIRRRRPSTKRRRGLLDSGVTGSLDLGAPPSPLLLFPLLRDPAAPFSLSPSREPTAVGGWVRGCAWLLEGLFF